MSRVIEITNSTEENNFINNNGKAVIFFGSERCHYCRNMIPIYQNLANKYPDVAFAHVEISRVAVDGLDSGVPLFIGYKNGVHVGTVLGANTNALSSMIENNIRR